MSVTAARGFRAAGVAAGLRRNGRPDLALVVNDGPAAAAAAVFTSNRVQAAPVRWTRAAVRDGELRAVVLNSGSANACTGTGGAADTRRTADATAAALALPAGAVAVCSTGLIGARLPMDRLLPGIEKAVADLSEAGGAAAAEAIRTTDTVAKEAVQRAGGWTAGGMAKGAGMLAPALATMLVVITTDAVATAAQLDTALRAATRCTFDRLDTDGCMSTNDTVLLLANGASGLRPTDAELGAAVQAVCADLTDQLVADAEGATKEIRVAVSGAASEDEAVEVGRSVARSNLLKCAVTGADPNWGRVLAAVGTTTARFDPDRLDVAFNAVVLCRDGAGVEPAPPVDLTGPLVTIAIELHEGDKTAVVRTTDLTAAYVHENSAYPT